MRVHGKRKGGQIYWSSLLSYFAILLNMYFKRFEKIVNTNILKMYILNTCIFSCTVDAIIKC